MIDHFVSQVFYVPGLHFNFDALRNGCGKEFRDTRKVLLPTSRLWRMLHVGYCLQWLDFNELAAIPDGIEFSHHQ